MTELFLKIKIFITQILIKNTVSLIIPQKEKFIHYWREYFFNSIFFIVLIINSILFMISMFFQFISGNFIFMAISSILFIISVMIVYLKKIPYYARSYTGCLIFYFIGLLVFIKFGPVSSGLFWLFLFSFFNATFNGFTGLIFSNLVIISTVVVFNFLIPVYDFKWPHITDDFYDSGLWWITGNTLAIINFAVSAIIYFFMKQFENALKRNSDSKNAIIIGLASLAEYRDNDTGKHLDRISKYTIILTRSLKKNDKYKDYITEQYIEDISISSILHDIGKVGIEDRILLNPGKLTEKEFEIIKTHPIIGSNVIKNINKKIEDKEFLKLADQIILCHHEKFDGTGYPKGLKGEEIPLSARIVALVDVYDALTCRRVYKEGLSHKQAVDIIISEKGKHFDPEIVDTFLTIDLHGVFDNN